MRRARFAKPSPIFSAAALRAEIKRDDKAKLDAEIRGLRGAVIAKRREVKSSTGAARAKCVADLKAKRAELDEAIARAKKFLREAKTERRGAKVRACAAVADETRIKKLGELKELRGQLGEKIDWREHERRTDRAARARGDRPVKDFRQETDQEVADNIRAQDPSLLPFWKKVKRSVKGSRDMTRTEAFWELVKISGTDIANLRAASVPSDDAYAREMAEYYGADVPF